MESRGEAVEGDGDGTKGGGAGGARKKGGKKRETGTRRRRNIQATLGEHTGDRRARARYGAREKERDVVAGGGGSGGGVAINTEPPEQNHPSTSISLSPPVAPSFSRSIYILLRLPLSPVRYRAFLRLPPSVYHPPPLYPSFSFSRSACTPNCHEYDGYMDAIERR